MSLLSSVNHVAIITDHLDRFVDFYADIFDMDVVFREDTPGFRHAILRTGADSWIHPVQHAGNPHGAAIPAMFERGHLDHMALTAQSQQTLAVLRDRLVARGASDGAVDDLGAFHALWFDDPDGMRVELSVIVDPTLNGIHEPRPIAIG